MSPTQNQYQYKTVFSEGRWGILAEDFAGNAALLYEKNSEATARATTEYLQTCRTRKVTSPRMESDWF